MMRTVTPLKLSQRQRLDLEKHTPLNKPDGKNTLDLIERLCQAKSLVMLNKGVLSKLDELLQQMPNFRQPIQDLKAQLLMAAHCNRPFVFKPMILGGEPGVGKSLFAYQLAQILGLPFYEESFEKATTGMILTGTSKKWSNGSAGAVAQRIAQSPVANFVFFIDEIDKSSRNAHYPSPINALHGLWEKDTAKRFQDEFLALPIDASHINWIAAANDVNKIPESILSRAHVYWIWQPDVKQMGQIAQKMYRQLRVQMKLKRCSSAKLSYDILNKLQNHSPREVQKRLEQAMGRALVEYEERIKQTANHQRHTITLQLCERHFPMMYDDIMQLECTTLMQWHEKEMAEKMDEPTGFIH
ncbi:MAG: ATP-binding protein [Alysiella sp.]|uniref:AAA family ATPase n=1 Tax=Alysiella sp. TaxID=1872483 RepID=UPI0026DB5954|nr:ATP-binding protein [Alysiella sp.]MDO4434609.1 ATP-binding protein [Alysiella sp.]